MPVASNNTSTELIAAVRRDCFLATADDNWTDDRIMSIADDCTLMIAAALKKTKQGWFQDDVTLTMVANQSEYDVPEEASWTSIERAWLVDAVTGLYYCDLVVTTSSDRMLFQSYNTTQGNTPAAIYLNHTQIVVLPAPSISAAAKYRMVISAYRRPAQLCAQSVTCQVTQVNSVTQVLTTTTQPSTWPTLAVDTYTTGSPYRIDVYNRLLPNTRKFWNQTMSQSVTTALTFSPTISAALFATISVGDVLAVKGTSPYPDLPPEGVPYLRRMIQKTILTAQTDSEALQTYLAGEADAAAIFIKGHSNRSDGSPRKLSLYNAGAARFLRSPGTFYRR